MLCVWLLHELLTMSGHSCNESVGNESASHCHPGAAHTLWPNEAWRWPAVGGNQVFLYQTTVSVLLAVTWMSLQPSMDTLPLIILEPPPNWSCWIMASQDTCAQCEPALYLWREQGVSGGPANSAVLWQMSVELHGVGLWAQVSLEDVEPSCSLDGVRFWLSGEKNACQYPTRGHCTLIHFAGFKCNSTVFFFKKLLMMAHKGTSTLNN